MARLRRLVTGLTVATVLASVGPSLYNPVARMVAWAQIRNALSSVSDLRVGGFEVDDTGQYLNFDNLRASGPGFRIAIGRMSVRLTALSAGGADAAPAPATVVTADNIRIEFSKSTVLIPRLEAKGTPLSAAALRQIFAATATDSLEARLARLSASELAAPRITVSPRESAGTDRTGSIILHDVVLTDVVAGRIGAAAVARIDVAGLKNGETTIASGKVAATRVDLPLAARIGRGSRTDAGEPMQPIVGNFSIESVKLKAPDVEIGIGSVRSGALQGRPLLTSPSDLTKLTDRPEAARTEKERRAVADTVADAFRSFGIDRLEVNDVSVATAGANPSSLTLGRLLVDGYDVGKIHTVAAERFIFAGEKFGISVDRLSLDGYDQTRMLNFLKDQNFAAGADSLKTHLGQFNPTLAGLSLRTMRFEAPAEDLKGNARHGTRHIIDVPAADLKVSSDAGGATDSSAHLQVIYDIAPDVADAGLQNLTKAGFGRFDIDTAYALNWNSQSREARLDQISISAKDLASLSLSGSFDHIEPGLFDAGQDGKNAAEAARHVGLRTLRIELANAGLAEKAFPIAAAAAGVSVPLFKAELKGQAQVALLKIFGDTPAYERISKEVSAFIDEPKLLTLSIKARPGLTFGAITESGDMAALLDRVEIDAQASR